MSITDWKFQPNEIVYNKDGEKIIIDSPIKEIFFKHSFENGVKTLKASPLPVFISWGWKSNFALNDFICK